VKVGEASCGGGKPSNEVSTSDVRRALVFSRIPALFEPYSRLTLSAASRSVIRRLYEWDAKISYSRIFVDSIQDKQRNG
jgi:hypothetical protein